MENKPIYLKWSNVELLKNVYSEYNFNGLYLHLLCLNGFNRIIYIGEGNILDRQTDYKKAYNKDNYNKYGCMDISKITGDPYTTYTNCFDNANSTEKVKQDGIYYEVNDVAKEGINITDIRRKYFESLYVSVAVCEEQSLRQQVECNLQKYFIDKWKILNYGGGYLHGLRGSFKNDIDNNLIIHNEYEDTRLSDLPTIISY